MVKVEIVEEKDQDYPSSTPYSASASSAASSEVSLVSEDGEETFYERIAALVDIVPPTTRSKISSRFASTASFIKASGKLVGNLVWIVTTSALLVGLPLALSLEDEAKIVAQEQEMLAQQQGAQQVRALGLRLHVYINIERFLLFATLIVVRYEISLLILSRRIARCSHHQCTLRHLDPTRVKHNRKGSSLPVSSSPHSSCTHPLHSVFTADMYHMLWPGLTHANATIPLAWVCPQFAVCMKEKYVCICVRPPGTVRLCRTTNPRGSALLTISLTVRIIPSHERFHEFSRNPAFMCTPCVFFQARISRWQDRPSPPTVFHRSI